MLAQVAKDEVQNEVWDSQNIAVGNSTAQLAQYSL